MAETAFLKIDNVPGDSKDSKHPGWVEIVDAHFVFERRWEEKGAETYETSADYREDRSNALQVMVSQQGTAAHKLYLASTGKLKLGGTMTLAAVREEHDTNSDTYSERTFKMKDVTVAEYQVYQPDPEYKGDGSVVKKPALAVVTFKFTATNPNPPPKDPPPAPKSGYRGYRGYGYGYGRYR